MELPYRKPTRLPNYDYSTVNFYFVTICTHEKKCLFFSDGKINDAGMIVEECICQISNHFAGVKVDKYIVMPNHIHAILIIENEKACSLTTVVGLLKSSATKKIHQKSCNISVWQRSFHDHIIRNQQSYEKIWSYIDSNLENWDQDCFFQDETEQYTVPLR